MRRGWPSWPLLVSRLAGRWRWRAIQWAPPGAQALWEMMRWGIGHSFHQPSARCGLVKKWIDGRHLHMRVTGMQMIPVWVNGGTGTDTLLQIRPVLLNLLIGGGWAWSRDGLSQSGQRRLVIQFPEIGRGNQGVSNYQ